MEKILKNIENSEENNSLLSAALDEVKIPTEKLNQAKSKLEMTSANTATYSKDGAPLDISFEQFKSTQLYLLSGLLF